MNRDHTETKQEIDANLMFKQRDEKAVQANFL